MIIAPGTNAIINDSNEAITLGDGDVVTINGSNDIVQGGSNENVTDNGTGNAVTLGDNSILTIDGTSDSGSVGGHAVIVDNGGGNTATIGAGSTLIQNGTDGVGYAAGGSSTDMYGVGNQATAVSAFVNIFGTSDTATAAGASIVTVGSSANSDTIEVPTGASITISENQPNTSINVQDTGGQSAISLNSTGDHVGLLGGAGYAVQGSDGSIATWDHTAFNVTGENDAIVTDCAPDGSNTSGSIGSVSGTGDTLSENGAGDTFNIQNTGASVDTVNLNGSSGDYIGLLGGSGYVVQGSNGSVGTWDNTHFTLTGDNDTIGVDWTPDGSSTAGSGGTIVGTSDTLTENGSGDRFTVQNSGTGTNTITLSGSSDYAAVIGGANNVVNNDNASDTVDLAGDATATISGGGGHIGIFGSDSITASNQSITFGTAPTNVVALVGGSGNTVNNNDAGDTVNLTNGVSATVNGDGNGSIGLFGSDTVTTSGAHIILATANVTDTVNGGYDTITTSAGDTIQFDGNPGYVVDGSGDTIDTQVGTDVTLSGNNDEANLSGNNTLVIAGGTGNVVTNDVAGDTVNLTSNTSTTITGSGGYFGVVGTNVTVTASGDSSDTSASASYNLTGSGNTLTLGPNSYVGILGGTGNVVTNDVAGDTVNVTANTSTTINGSGGYFGVFGTGVTITASGESSTTAPNVSYNLTGNGNTLTLGPNSYLGLLGGTGNVVTDDVAGETVNLASNTSTIINGSGGYFGVVGTGVTVAASGESSSTSIGASYNLTGNNNSLYLDSSTKGSVTGTGNTLTEGGANVSFAATNTGVGTNTVIEDGSDDVNNVQDQVSGGYTNVQLNAANGYVGLLGGGGYGVSGSGGEIATWSNTTFGVTGNSDSINTGGNSTGSIAGTGDRLVDGPNDTFSVTNTGSGTNTVAEDGPGDFVNVADQATGSTTNVQFNSSNDYAGLIGGTGYSVTGSFGTIATVNNTSFDANGSNDLIYASQGGTAAVIGGGNTIFGGSDTAVIVAGTGGQQDAITISGSSADQLTAAGQQAGVTLLDGASATISGSNDTVLAGDGTTVSVLGNGNATIVGTGATTVIAGDYNAFGAVSGGSVTFFGVNNAGAANGTAVNSGDGNPIALSGASSTAGNTLSPITQANVNAEGIDEVYLEVLGRDVDPAGLADAQAQLLEGGTLDGLRSALASGTEAQGDFVSTLASVGATAPGQAEIDAFSTVMAGSYDAPIVLVGSQGELADTSAANLLTELPVLETLDNGRTLSLVVAGTTQVMFQTTADLAAFLYAVSVQKSQADSLVTDTFNADITWLNTVDQPMLDVAEHWSDVAAYDTRAGLGSQATLANAASELALMIAAEPVGSRAPIYRKVSVDGHQTKVTVYPGTNDPMGDATFHDIDPGVGGILEAAGVAILNVAAAVFPETGLPYVAAVVDAGVAAQDFSNGQIVEGLLQLASAAGSFEIGLGGGNALSGATQTGQIINTAAQGVGGIYGVVQSAQNGDALGVLAGVLESAAAVAGGIGENDQATKQLANQVAKYLSIGSAVASVSDAFSKGNIAGGLLASLGPALSNLASYYLDTESPPNTSAAMPFGVDPNTDGQVQLAGDQVPPFAARFAVAMGLIGTDAHNTLAKANSANAQITYNTEYGGIFGGHRPDFVYQPLDGSPLQVIELKPVGQETLAASQLSRDLSFANAKDPYNPVAVAGDPRLLFNYLPGIILTSTGFLANSTYSYSSGGLPGVAVYTMVDRSNSIQLAFSHMNALNFPSPVGGALPGPGFVIP